MMSRSALNQHVGCPQLQFQPTAISRESPRSSTPLSSPLCPPGELSNETVQSPVNSRRGSNTGALEATVEHITQGGRFATHGFYPSLSRLSRLSSALSPALSPRRSSGSASYSQNSKTRVELALSGQTHFCIQRAMIPRSDFAVSINRANSGMRVHQGIPRINVCRLPFNNPSVRAHQGSPPRTESCRGSETRVPESTEDMSDEFMSGASPALVHLRKTLLNEYRFSSKTSFLERESRRPHRSNPDSTPAADFKVPDLARDNAEHSSVEAKEGMDRAFDEVTSQKACVLDAATLPEAARRFLLASFLFLRDGRAEFYFWTKLHKAHHELVHLFPQRCYTKKTQSTTMPLLKKQPNSNQLDEILREEQAVFGSAPHLSESQSAGRSFLEIEPRTRHSERSTAERVLSATNKSATPSCTYQLQHWITTDTEARDVLQLDDPCVERGESTSRSATHCFRGAIEAPSVEFTRARCSHRDKLNESEDEEDETHPIEKLSGELLWSSDLRTSGSEVDGESVGSSDEDKTSHGTGAHTDTLSVDTSARGCEETSHTLSYGKLSRNPDVDRVAQLDSVLAQLKSAARTSRTSLQVLRSELISMQAITEGSLLAIISELLNSNSPPTPSTMVLPLVASAYVLILASLLEARKRCCQLLVACCHSLCAFLEHQRYKVGQVERVIPRWHTTSAKLRRQMELLDTSTLKLTSSFVADAQVAFVNVLAIVYPFASLVHARRLRRHQARERAIERRLKMRRIQLDSLAMKCQNALADIQLREGKLRQRLAAAMRSQQAAASRAQDLSISIDRLRQQELTLQSNARASSNRDHRHLLGLQAKLEQVEKQRQQQQLEMATANRKARQTRTTVEAIQKERQRSAEASRLLQQERAALLSERKNIERRSGKSNERFVHGRADMLEGTRGAAITCKPGFQDERREEEGLLRCVVELTQLVIQALKFHANATMNCNRGPTRSAELALLNQAYKQYRIRIVKENDFRHTLLSCTQSESLETGTDSTEKMESEASLCHKDRSLSLQSSSALTLSKSSELAISVELVSVGIENIRARPEESKRASGDLWGGSTCEADDVYSSNTSPLRICSSERTPVCRAPKRISVRGYEGPNIDSKSISHLLQEPLLIARLTAVQVMSTATAVPLNDVTGAAWELMDELLAVYDETRSVN